jgi:hypothetical protein
MARLCRLYARQAQDRIFASFDLPSPTLADLAASHSEGFCPEPDPNERIRFWDALCSERKNLHDDSLPVAYLSEFDQGLYGGLVGGDVQFMLTPQTGWVSSMVKPILTDWSQADRLRFDPNHPWFYKYLRQLVLFRDGARGRFGISHCILIDGLNFVFELVGATETYLALFDRPETVRRAIDFAFDLNVKVQEAFFETVGLFHGGTFSNFAQWLPGRIVSESLDPFHMTSVEDFEIWGRPNAQRMFDHFDGGVLHIHANGRHLLEAACTLRGLQAIYMLNDRGFPTSFEIIDELKRCAGDVPLTVDAPWGDFCGRLNRRELPGGVFYRVTGAPQAASANQCMNEVIHYRAT